MPTGGFGYSAKRTLQIAQQLYEKHKVLTYPRTDSRYLPEDNLSNGTLYHGQLCLIPSSSVHADKAMANGWVRLTKRVFDNSKVSDHNAIIPNRGGAEEPGRSAAERFSTWCHAVSSRCFILLLNSK